MEDKTFVYTGEPLTFTGALTTTTNCTIAAGGTMASIGQDGKVAINWDRVEKVASDQRSGSLELAYARLMLAIRDGTWTALATTNATPPSK